MYNPNSTWLVTSRHAVYLAHAFWHRD